MNKSLPVRGRSGFQLCLLFLLLLLMIPGFGMRAEARITFDRAEVNIMKGRSKKIQIYCSTKKKKNFKVRSTNSSIATVTASGKVHGKKAGTCQIIVTNGAESASISVHVRNSIRSADMMFIGHRGYQDKYPENTISSFRGALKYGAAGVEFDVYLTKSNDLLIFHDLDLSRMCGANVPIHDITAQSRFLYKVKAHGKNDIIPTFEETMQFLASQGKIAYIHLKEPHNMNGAAGDELAECIRRYGMTGRSVVFCNNLNTISYFHTHHPDIVTGHLYNGSSTMEALTELLSGASSGATYFFLVKPKTFSYDLVLKAHELGMKIGLYKTKKESTILNLMDYGADFAMLYHKLIKK